MRLLSFLMVALSTAAVSGGCAREEAGTLQAATKALGASEVRSIEYSGTGRWFQFGQAPNPTLPWPPFDVSAFTASVNYDTTAALVYLPAERILIEADAFTPGAANAPPPATPNPFTVNLNESIARLKLDVRQIAALHGPRVTTMADLRAAIGATGATN